MTPDEIAARDLADRLVAGTLGAFDLATIYIGDRLGLYRALAEIGSATAAQLAGAASVQPRFVREWCEQQAAAGLLDCPNPAAEPDERRFTMAPAHREILADRDGPRYGVGNVLSVVNALAGLPGLPDRVRLEAITPALNPADAAERAGVGEANRPWFRHHLAGWLASVPAIHDRLVHEPPARVLDVACGAGWSSLAIAAAFPLVTVDAIDLDESAIALAQRHAAEGLAHRVLFRRADATDPPGGRPYDLVCCFEALHDLPDPIAALAAWRRSLAPGGICLVADARTEPGFTAPAGALERIAYGWSVADCLPATMAAGAGAKATGAVLRPATLERYAGDAGFAAVEVLPIDDPGWRFYRLVP
jgi:2-polyprenyl-3-methyl-5-hydroxy-6-metoxy-1,4-benzoquinol methylase